jgi:hypothetical protein
MTEVVELDPEQQTTEQLLAHMWEQGDLRQLMHAGQVAMRDQFHAWRKIDQTNDVQHVAGALPRVFGVKGGKRFGKTTAALWIASELCALYPGCSIRYTSAFQKTIDEIIGSVQHVVFDTAPPSCKPQYFGKRGPRPAGFYFPEYGPMAGARIALAGMELNPDALRGQGNDFDFISEAAFIVHLGYTVINVLYHQYQGRPHARLMVETSAPADLDTDWETIFLPDCERRGALYTATIEDNPRLSRAEKDEFIAAAGGRGHSNCEREYFNVISGDPILQVVPEFNERAHVRDVPIPANGYAIVAADPGTTHMFALVFAIYDFDNAHLIIQDSWAESNASTRKVACVCAAREFDLWGTWPPHKLKSIPLDGDDEQQGWRQLLAGDRCESLAELLHEMACTDVDKRGDYETRPGRWIREAPRDHLTYFDGAHRVNPYMRTSDIELRFIRDVEEEHGLRFEATVKDESLEVRVNTLRNWVGGGQVVWLPTAGPAIAHTRAGKWNKQKTKFDEHRVYGHYDALAAEVYLVRAAELIRGKRPHPPSLPVVGTGVTVIERLPWQPMAAHERNLDLIQRHVLGRPEKGRMRLR